MRGLKFLGTIIKVSVVPVAVIALLVYFYGRQLTSMGEGLEFDWRAVVAKAIFVVGVIVVAGWLQMLAGQSFRWYTRRVAGRTSTAIDDKFMPLFTRIAGLFIWVIAIIVALSHLGININALIAAMGVGSLAIALAAQDTIANIIAGFMIMVDRPFETGDLVGLPTGEKVTAITIGIRRSKFRLDGGAMVIVPNLDLSKNKIVNYSRVEEDTR